MKKGIIIVVLLVAAAATIPLWGSCDLKADFCSTWCNIKHFNSDNKATGCRARCAMEAARCHSEEAAEGFSEALKGLRGK